jgi:nitrile hydratase
MSGVQVGGLAPVPALFKPGDRVRVRKIDPPGHIRTPHYCRGHSGVIERICGAFPNPEELAYNRTGLPAQPLYRVRFKSTDLWPDYRERADDVVEIEIYQHWLERG